MLAIDVETTVLLAVVLLVIFLFTKFTGKVLRLLIIVAAIAFIVVFVIPNFIL